MSNTTYTTIARLQTTGTFGASYLNLTQGISSIQMYKDSYQAIPMYYIVVGY